MRIALAVVVVGAALGGCASFHGVARQQCLRGDVPRVGRGDTDEIYGFMRREWERSRTADSPLARARILEAIPSLIPDASDVLGEPTCSPELVDDIDDVLDHRPIEYSRLLIARIRAAGQVGDTTDVMERKAAFLMAVARLTDAELTDYRRGAEEPGPVPPRSLVRYLALGYLGRSNVFLNVAEVRTFAVERLRTTRDDRERLLLTWIAREYFEARRTSIPIDVPDGGASIIDGWLADARSRLAVPPARISLELVIDRLERLGRHAPANHREREADALFGEIIESRGRFPLTREIAGADRDLARVALGARLDLVAPPRGAVAALPALRTRFDPWRDWLDREPAGGRITPAASARRLAELDGELGRVKYAASRCVVLTTLAKWVPPQQADARFDAMTADLRLGHEDLCRIHAAFSIEGVAAERRSHLLVTLLRPGLSPAAAWVLSQHPEWIDASTELRAVLAELAARPFGGEGDPDEMLAELEPAFERLLGFDASNAPGANLAEGAAIVKQWFITIRATIPRPGHSIYPSEAVAARLLAIGELAPAFGLEDEARALFAEVMAAPTPSAAAVYTHPPIVRAATIAATLLAPGPATAAASPR